MTKGQLITLLAFVLAAGIIIGALAWNILRPAQVVEVSVPVVTYDTTEKRVEVPYYPEWAADQLQDIWDDLKHAETEYREMHKSRNRWAIAWLRQVPDEAFDNLPGVVHDDPELLHEWECQQVKRFGKDYDTLAPIAAPKPPSPPKIKRAGFCLLPGISAGMETSDEWRPSGYFDIEWAWVRSGNICLGVNPEAIKPLHLRYRLPLFTRNLMIGGYIAKPFEDFGNMAWEKWRKGAALSVSF